MFKSKNYLINVSLLSSLFLSLLTTKSVEATSLDLSYLGQSIIPTGTQYQGTEVGGLSGISYDPSHNSFYILSDDRSQINSARFYTATIDPTQFNASGNNNAVTFTGTPTFLQANGQTFPKLSLDPEGIALYNGNSVFVTSEGEVSTSQLIDPFVNQFSLSGVQEQALTIPNQFIPDSNTAPTNGVRNNLALESLTITPDQKYLFTASENALVQDGPMATVSNSSPSRILQYDLTTGQPGAQYLYNADPVALPPNPPTAFNVSGLPDLLALDNTGKHFLSLERSFSVGAPTLGNTGNTIKIYDVSLDGATDISGYSSINGVTGIVPAQKTLVLDLDTLGIPLDNLEGIVFGPNLPDGNQSLIMVSDNNFDQTQFTQFLAFEVKSVPEPNQMLGGLLTIGLFFTGLRFKRTKN